MENFYPSLSRKLLADTRKYIKKILDIDNDQLKIIMQTRKTRDVHFDVWIGFNDGVVASVLVSLFILKKLRNFGNKENIGLYRDDGLSIFQNISKTKKLEEEKGYCQSIPKLQLTKNRFP